MKLMKLSLVAALLVGSSAFAIDNTKVSGDASIFYGTDDGQVNGAGNELSMFDQGASFGQAKLGLALTTDLSDTVKGNLGLTVLSTLGLENQLVSGVWEGTNGTGDSYWFDTANISANLGNTNVTVGRLELDTPLVFTETWSIAKNTFEAAVIANTDIPKTTLIGAYVGGSNDTVSDLTGNFPAAGFVVGGMNANGTTNFHQFYNGAYAAGAINNSWKPLSVQAWYYGATSILNAYWAQADLSISGINVGVQYTGGKNNDDTTIDGSFAAMVGYEMKDTFSISGSFSQTGTAGSASNLSGSQSKLYTEAWYVFMVGAADTSAFNLTASTSVAGIDFGAYYTSATTTTTVATVSTDNTQTEITVDAAKSFDNFDTAIAYSLNTDESNLKDLSTVQIFLTYNY